MQPSRRSCRFAPFVLPAISFAAAEAHAAINTAQPPHSKLTSPGATLVMNLLHMLNPHSLLL